MSSLIKHFKEDWWEESLRFFMSKSDDEIFNRFISFLANKEKELEKKLSLDMFGERLLEFANTIKGYSEYLEKDFNKWQSILRSSYDDDRKFNGDDQPVVGVT